MILVTVLLFLLFYWFSQFQPKMFSIWSFLLLTALTLRTVWTDDGTIQIPVEHSFGDFGQFRQRGFVTIEKSPVGDQTAEYVPGPWTETDEKALLATAKKGGMYKIRAPSRFGAESIVGDSFVMSSTPACSLLESQLTDHIHLTIDSSRQRILSIASFPLASRIGNCQVSSMEDDVRTQEFNTTVRLVDAVDGPIPETQAYLQKVEREKQERQRGEQGDNRSFLAKYWMYIVPVVVVLMLSSAMNPEAQGGGGGNR